MENKQLTNIINEAVVQLVKQRLQNENKTRSPKTLKEEVYSEQDDVESYIAPGQLNDILQKNGWVYSGFNDVHSKDGSATGCRYRLEKETRDATPIEEVVKELQSIAGNPDAVILSIGQYRYAPEIKSVSIIVLDRPVEEMYGEAFNREINSLVENISRDIMSTLKNKK